ncbi:sulfotransferase family 2 domain-containing protein [Coraliomargarita sp. SDUM461004]|uniref:Sulfotransferase family 2 domain-containing protein n=1 Tax=Thalassobacterium sedimentorum TaxID=3041258 RepID=A0ABU1ALK3_9BACT|nr:sulfotransferase family 2 domain-containing protein [Coraliomargarita sp. SDUM461004]MDQ8195592.1 sulfotransferase family 2 domain-containing protein [Coraliomargarita sp. SDUM461004]
MAYSRKNKLLFIHIPKNAGKSVEVALDLVPKELVLSPRFRSILNRFSKLLLKLTSNEMPREILFGPIDYTLCAQHLTYAEIEMLNLISNDQLDDLIVFSIVRNPYSRAISTYRHFCGNLDLSEFKDFWSRRFELINDHNKLAHLRTQKSFLVNPDGRIAVPNLLHFETLESDLRDFCQSYSLSFDSLPKLGQAHRIDYREFYDDEAKNLISVIFEDDFEAFDYDFDYE